MGLGKLHVVIVHFPIALVIAAAAADVLWVATRREFFKNAGMFCLVAAAISAIPVVITGAIQLDAKEKLYEGARAEIADDHEAMGYATLAAVLVTAAVRLLWMKWPRRWLIAVYAALMIALVVCVSITGDLGGQLVHGQNFLKHLF